MRARSLLLVVSIGCSAVIALSAAIAETAPQPILYQSLKSPSEFQSIGDQAARSRAIFTEISKVLTHPRCMGCHPAGDRPLQGADRHPHEPPVWRDATTCAGCHGDANYTLHERASYQSIPGHPRWGLAAPSMAWEGKSIGDICRQIKDTNRNGGRDLAMLQEHIAKDDLVAWAWNPGQGREPTPGSQDEAGKLVQAWIGSGAQCP